MFQKERSSILRDAYKDFHESFHANEIADKVGVYRFPSSAASTLAAAAD